MQIALADLDAYFLLAGPDRPPEERATSVARFQEALARGKRDLADFRVARREAGGLCAGVRLAPAEEGTFDLIGPFVLEGDPGADAAAASLVGEAMERAETLGARTVRARPRVERAGPAYRAALLDRGFRLLGERIEFKTPATELPTDDGTPLVWKDMAATGEAFAAGMLKAVAVGDPHSTDADEDPRAALAAWLGEPGLTGDPACVQIGFLEEHAVAFLCAQVNPENGWARITYMGVVPDARGRGLGAWVHRRGFGVLRERGGRLYHGGTAATNQPMLRLFRRHGCRESAHLLELEWRAAASAR